MHLWVLEEWDADFSVQFHVDVVQTLASYTQTGRCGRTEAGEDLQMKLNREGDERRWDWSSRCWKFVRKESARLVVQDDLPNSGFVKEQEVTWEAWRAWIESFSSLNMEPVFLWTEIDIIWNSLWAGVRLGYSTPCWSNFMLVWFWSWTHFIQDRSSLSTTTPCNAPLSSTILSSLVKQFHLHLMKMQQKKPALQ